MKRLGLLAVAIGVVAGGVLWILPRTGAFFGQQEKPDVMPSGRQFYASPTGTHGGDGSLGSPWDLPTAFAHQPSVAAGDILNLRGGTYKTADGSHFFSKLKGAEDKYILVRPQEGEHVLIEGGIEVDGPFVIIRDLEVASNNPDRLSEQETSFPTDTVQLVGFNVFAQNVKIVNNIVHDNSAGMDAWAQAPDSEYYGNLVYYNGWHSNTKKAHGHGIYMQNTSGAKYVRDNIIFSQFASGMQIYGSEKADLVNFHVEGNIVFNNGILNHEHSRNLLIGGGKVARKPVVKDNYMYFPPEKTLGGDHNIGYDPFGVGCTGLKFTGNYIASDGPALTLFKCTVDELEDNTLYGELKGFKREEYPNNEYFDRSSPARGVHTFVRPNRFEPGRANIVIFNWNHVSSVDLDVSKAGLKPGDGYEIHTAQDYFGDVKTGTFDGKPITVSMIDRSVALPVGVPAPPSTFPEFGVFVIRKASQPAAPAVSGAGR